MLTVSYQGGGWGVSVVWGMGMGADDSRSGWWRPRWTVHLDWLPVWGVSSRSARVEAGVARDPADEPMFSGRDLASIGVGLVPFLGAGQSIVELITGRDHITGEPVHRGLAAAGVLAKLDGR